jgi:fatty-acyl-CoA synthase
MWVQATTIADLLDRTAASNAGDALVMPSVRLTYPELAARTDRFAASLRATGVSPGDKIGILMPNTVDYVTALVAASKLGAISVPINSRFKVREVHHVITDADIKVLLLSSEPNSPDFAQLLLDAFPSLESAAPGAIDLPDAPVLRAIVDFNGTHGAFIDRATFDGLGASVPVSEVRILQKRVRIRDTALIMYTSGTTSKPKGCLLSHEAITRQATNVATTRFMLSPGDAMWNPLPLFHCGGIVPMLGCFATGAKYCHSGHFEAGAAIRMIADERCSVLYPAFETIWRAVLDHPTFSTAEFAAVRLVQNIATPTRLIEFERRMPWAKQVSSYGSTECATNLTMALPTDPYEVRMNTLGRPVEGMEIRITDPETGAPLPPNIMGELCFRGYSMFDGYYHNPEQTAACMDAEGWFHTGDRAKVDVGGNLIYGDRLKDVLKVGGENVGAAEIEDYLSQHAAVRLVQVVAAPDARYDEVPAAFIELYPGATMTEADVIQFCLGALASFKVPRYVRFVTDWPMSGTKIQKFVLRGVIARELKDNGVREAPHVSVHRRAAAK